MKKQLPIGKSDFKAVIEQGYYYVDKSLFIRDVIDSAEVCLITRPRRFGKTINLSLLRYFYSNESDYSHLFTHLAISQTAARYMGKQGKHPVIAITFKDIKAKNWEEAYERISYLIRESFMQDFGYLLDSDQLNSFERNFLNTFVAGTSKKVHYANYLKTLSQILAHIHKQNTVILIDEYDSPIHAAYMHGYYDEMLDFMRDFLSGGMKDNRSLEKGVITGIMRVAKESIFSGLNNLDDFSILTHRMAESFGFGEQELEKLLRQQALPEESLAEIQRWYNGYVFGGRVIYNPWSIIQYADKPEEGIRPYWVNTSDNMLLKQLFFSGLDIKEELQHLIQGKTIRKEIFDNLVFKELDHRAEAVWTLLVFSGYLKAENLEVNDTDRTYQLSIPNKEVAYIYKRFIKNWLREQVPETTMNPMLKALTQGNVEVFEDYFSHFVLQVFSFYDTQGTESEAFYHAFLLGLVVSLQNEYLIKSNRESGFGRYDLMLAPKSKHKKGILIEIKRPQKRRNHSLKDALEIAKTQISNNAYIAELQALGIEDILKLAIAVAGKHVLVEEVRN